MFKKQESDFTYFNEEWNAPLPTTEAQSIDDYGDDHVDGVDEWFPTKDESSTIED